MNMEKTDYPKLLKTLEEQEKDFQFNEFTNEMGLEIGLTILAKARQRAKPLPSILLEAGINYFITQ
jgi:hypothetical protein